MRAATPRYLEGEFGISTGAPLPYLAAYEVAVDSLVRLRMLLDRAKVPYALARNAVVVPLPPSVGGTILFRETSA
jgi:hypothetical protein